MPFTGMRLRTTRAACRLSIMDREGHQQDHGYEDGLPCPVHVDKMDRRASDDGVLQRRRCGFLPREV